MVQSYLRHGPTQAFGLICSSSANSIYDGKLAYVPALEDVLVWDVKKGQMLAMWHETGHRAEVTCIIRSPRPDVFAVGYADGSIRLWSASAESITTVLNGHKKSVTAMTFDTTGTRLASGSQDTDIIIWDVVAEAGLYRLRGHRDQITALKFVSDTTTSGPSSSTSAGSGHLLSGSKDTLLKLWDMSTQHCIQTIVAHRMEIWSFDMDKEQGLLFTGSGEGELKAWNVDQQGLQGGVSADEAGEIIKFITPLGVLPLSTKHRISQISFHPTLPYVAVQSHDRSVEIFKIRTEEEARKKLLRRRKRAKEKKDNNGKADDDDGTNDTLKQDTQLVDLFTPHLIIRSSGKIRSFDFAVPDGNKTTFPIFLALATNALEVFNIPPYSKSKGDLPEATKTYSLDLPGHRTDVRSLSLTSDDNLLASASNGSLKIWNIQTTSCIRTMDCGYAICSRFLPGDRYIAVGTKNGEIMVYDIASSQLVDAIQAHDATIWSMDIRPDQSVLVTGSADKDVKFWDIDLDGSKRVTLSHARTLKMTDDVLSVRYSPNARLLAVALLDATIKVFHQDTLKFFLSLYGHKLPVLSMDISHDSKLIVTCSADKNVKIWGLDFGDCHKSIFAHDESIMQVAFERDSHYFWTVSKDKLLKYWDGDKFENIQKLDGHHGEVWALVTSHSGKFVATGSHDKSIRIWEKLDEPLFLEEEREREMEALYDANLLDTTNRDEILASGANDAPQLSEVTTVTKQTSETLMAGERIMEALDLADGERAAIAAWEANKAALSEQAASKLAPPDQNPVLKAYGMTPEKYVLSVIERVQAAALYDALLVLPFGSVLSLMTYLDEWAKWEWNIALVSRILFFLLRTHHHQIVTNRVMRNALIPLREHLRSALRRQKGTIDYNLAALRHIARQHDAQRTADFYEQGLEEEQVRLRIMEGKKRKRVSMKA